MRRYLKIITWLIVIFYLSLAPADSIPSTPVFAIPHFDKLVHFGMYFIFSILLIALLEMRNSKRDLRNGIIVISISVLLGALMEVFQLSLPKINRSGDLYDMMANTLGGICGTLIWIKWIKETYLKKLFI